jgi:sporulation protein YlmC with PRC-barrel domain
LEAGISPLPTGTAAASIDLDAPTPAGKPPQSPAAAIRQPELRPELTRLSTLLGYQVLDQEGTVLGTVSDFIANTCETYLIYFLLDPAAGLGVAAGSQIVTPFEVVTINSGVFDAQARTLQLSVAAGQVARAPAYPASLKPVTSGWEAAVRDYWSRIARVSSLTTGCRVSLPGGGTTEIHKVAYAHELIGAVLRDGLGNELGQVEEAILEPESGKLSFFVVRLGGGQGLVLAPLRVFNIPKEALLPEGEISLVLLVEADRFLGAPRINSVEEAVQGGAQSSARAYWNR